MEKIRGRAANLEKEKIALKNIPHLTIIYEKDLLESENHQATLDRIFDYINIHSVKVKTKYSKTTPSKLSDIVKNYDELKEVIRNTEFAKFLFD